MKPGLPSKQKGAAAIEFAAVFVIFFAVFYGLVSYSLPLLMMQSFNQATAEAVRRAVAVDPNSANYTTTVQNLANSVVLNQTLWIPPPSTSPPPTTARCTPTACSPYGSTTPPGS